MNHFKCMLTLLIFGFSIKTMAQKEFVSSGGDFSGAGGSVAFSIGQIEYSTFSDGTVYSCEGVQQPYEFFECIEDNNFPIDVSIFPNPTSDILNIKIENCCNDKLSFQIFDDLGRLVKNNTSISTQATINVKLFSASIYFLKFYKDGQPVKTIKFLKK